MLYYRNHLSKIPCYTIGAIGIGVVLVLWLMGELTGDRTYLVVVAFLVLVVVVVAYEIASAGVVVFAYVAAIASVYAVAGALDGARTFALAIAVAVAVAGALVIASMYYYDKWLAAIVSRHPDHKH